MSEEPMKVVNIEVGRLIPAPFNPESRVAYSSLKMLEEEIKKAGRILSPLHVTRSLHVADGHRRLAVAKHLGYPYVPCIVHEDTDNAQALWAQLNAATRPIDPGTWVAAYDKGLDLEYFPPRQKSQMIGLMKILRPPEFAEFVAKKRSPGLLSTAYWVANYCHDPSDAFVREIILWAMKFEQMSILRNAIREGLSIDRVIEVILNKERMHRGWI